MNRTKALKQALLTSIIFIIIMAPLDYYFFEKPDLSMNQFAVKILIQFTIYFIAMFLTYYYINKKENNNKTV